MPEARGPEEYIGVEAAAARLRVSRTKVWRLIREGRLTAHTDVLDRRRKMISVEELDRLAQGRVEPHEGGQSLEERER